MNMNLIIAALEYLRPGAEWELSGDTYDALDWRDSAQNKPTQTEIEGAIILLEKQSTIKSYAAAIQKRLDDFARTRNYDGLLSAATYATSAVPKFKTEGQYAVAARDATWAKGYEILAAVEAGTRAAPTLDELAAELPALAWPQ
jgi:hypothetical protein